MNRAVIGLGSNIDPTQNIKKARALLKEHFHVLRESSFVQTKPFGYTQQADFINGCVYIETDLDEIKIKVKLKSLEKELGREVSPIKYGPRSIDMDIVVFNQRVVDRDFYQRDFLKRAVLELLPQLKY